MRNRLFLFVVFAWGAGLLVARRRSSLLSPGPRGAVRRAKAAAAAAPKPAYDPHDLTGVWRGVNVASASGRPRDTLMGGAPAPPMTAWGQEQFNAHKPSEPYADDSRKVPPAQGNDPLGTATP